MSDMTAARALGWASIGIGLTEIAATHWLEKQMGIGEHHGLLRALGTREILSGVDILAQKKPTAGLWSRVAGDAMDLALLGAAAKESRKPMGLAMAAGMVLGITALDVLYAKRLSQSSPALPS